MTFEECAQEAMRCPELLKQYDRLNGTRLSAGSSAPIETMIDEITGYKEKQWHDFLNFVRDYIWLPVVRKTP